MKRDATWGDVGLGGDTRHEQVRKGTLGELGQNDRVQFSISCTLTRVTRPYQHR